MTLTEFKDEALKRFTSEITDLFFCYIEDNKDLLQEYLRIIGRAGDLDSTNMALGKAVKDCFKLENGVENQKPKSKLIRSYTEHLKM